jgi:hypothetical protein
MAVDDRQKRASATSLVTWARVPGVDNTSLDQPERQASVWSYSGILALGAVAATAKYKGFLKNVGKLGIRIG